MRHHAVTALFVACTVAACGARQHTDESEPDAVEVEVEFAPMVITADVDDDGSITTATTDMPSLFAEANDYLRADDYDNALRLYRVVLEHYDDDDFRRVTHYNMGLAYEGLGRYDDAAGHFEAVVEGWRGSEDATYAFFRLAECYAQLGRYDEVPALMEAVHPRAGLEVMDRVEAHLREGNALLEMRRYAEALEHFDRALLINRSALNRWQPGESPDIERPLDPGDAMIAQTHFGRGRVYHELFLEIRLVLPEERLTQDLIDKGQLFEQAQEGYLDSVRTGHPYWAPAGGYMVGQLFEDFYFDVLAAEIPETFNEIELEVYFEEMRNFIQPAMERAMAIYENNLAMAYRLGADNHWVDSTLESIERVQAYLFEHEGWAEEEQLIIERRHPRSAFFADQMVFRADN